MTALIPSIYITNNYKRIVDYFLGQRSPNIQNLVDDEGSLFITPQNNRYLESFEMSYNIEKSERDCLTLVVVDTDGEFEKRIVGFNLDAAKRKTTELYGDSIQKRIENINVNLNTISQYVAKANQIYVAFGTGNNFADWSEPKVFRLNTTKVDVSNNGLRRYTLGFVPSYYSIFRPKLIFNLEKANPESEFFYTRNIENVFGTLETNAIARGGVKYDTLSKVIYAVVKSYIRSITGADEGNIIGIIPELDIKVPNNLEDKTFKELLNKSGIDLQLGSKISASFANRLTSNPYLPPQLGAITAAQQANSKVPDTKYYIMESVSPEKTELNPKFPDFYEPLNKLNIFIRSHLKLTDNFVLIEENDCRVLEFFKDRGLIANASQKCIIFGMDRMIHSWLFRDFAPAEENATMQQVLDSLGAGTVPQGPKLTDWGPLSSLPQGNIFSDPFKEYKIIQKSDYAKEFISWVSKRRTNSNFSENYSLDELSLSEKSKEIAKQFDSKQIRELFNNLSIPVFTNNLRNSNILEMQLLNSESYLEGLNISVNSNFARFFLSNITRNLKEINLGVNNLDSVLNKTNELLAYIILNPETKNLIDSIEYQYAIRNGSNLPSTQLDPIKKALEDRDNFQRYESFKITLNKILTEKFSNLTSDDINYLNSYVNVDKFVETYFPEESAGARFIRANFTKSSPAEFELNSLLRQLFKTPEFTKLFLGYEKLIIQNKGNLDLDSLLIAQAAIELGRDVDLNISNYYNLVYRAEEVFNLKRIPDPNAKKELDARFEKVSKIYQYASIVNSLFVKDNANKRTGIQFTPRNFGLGQDEIVADLYHALAQRSWKVSIKTLPFFYLSNPRLIAFKPCFLFSKKLNLIGNPKQSELDFFSGMYNIISFKHVINIKEAYSEFILVKKAFNASLV